MKMFYSCGAKVKNLQHKMVNTQFSRNASINTLTMKIQEVEVMTNLKPIKTR